MQAFEHFSWTHIRILRVFHNEQQHNDEYQLFVQVLFITQMYVLRYKEEIKTEKKITTSDMCNHSF